MKGKQIGVTQENCPEKHPGLIGLQPNKMEWLIG